MQRRAGVSSQGSVVGWLCERELTWPCCLLGDPVALVFSVFPHQCQESKEVQFPFQGRDLAGFTDTHPEHPFLSLTSSAVTSQFLIELSISINKNSLYSEYN